MSYQSIYLHIMFNRILQEYSSCYLINRLTLLRLPISPCWAMIITQKHSLLRTYFLFIFICQHADEPFYQSSFYDVFFIFLLIISVVGIISLYIFQIQSKITSDTSNSMFTINNIVNNTNLVVFGANIETNQLRHVFIKSNVFSLFPQNP